MTLPLLTTHNLTKTYPGVRALDGVDFDLMAGEVHVLFGENGAGKSTLISMLAGANTPSEGKIYLDHHEVAFDLMLVFCLTLGMQQVALKATGDDISPVLQIALRSGLASSFHPPETSAVPAPACSRQSARPPGQSAYNQHYG